MAQAGKGGNAPRRRGPERDRKNPCVVCLTHVWFNHDPNGLATDAFNIRVDATTAVDLPEWETGHRRAEESPAAYALEETRGNTLTIKARFTIEPATLTSAQVRARLGAHLGPIDPTDVTFVGGISQEMSGGVPSEYVTIPLNNATLHQFGGIRSQDITWAWEYRCHPSEAWQNLEVTRHRIYAVLREPPLPWRQNNPAEYPWTQVLDHVCRSAFGRDTNVKASTAVTQHTYGQHGAKYENTFGIGRYCNDTARMNLTSYMNQIQNTGLVNCHDQAGAITALSTTVGCEMVFNYHKPFGYLNIVVPVGWGRCNNPYFGSDVPDAGCTLIPSAVGPIANQDEPCRTYFDNHAYGVLAGKLYDACMKMPNSWLIDVTQAAYVAATIDESTPQEAARGGRAVAPVPRVMTVY